MASHRKPPSPDLLPAAARPALEELSLAFHSAHALGKSIWDFAVELEELRFLGLTNAGLRFLVSRGLAEHAAETTPIGASDRSFRRTGTRILPRKTCVVLTPAGVAFAQKLSKARKTPDQQDKSSPPPSAAPRGIRHAPRWEKTAGELSYAGEVVKRILRSAPNQRLILDSFQEQHWRRAIDDPLPGIHNLDSKKRLHDVIGKLNSHMLRPLIAFHGTGNGKGIRWEART